MPDFEFLEHTADLKFKAIGKTIDEALVNSSLAIVNAILGEYAKTPVFEKKFDFKFESFEQLVHDWLSELLFEIQYEGLVPTVFEIKINEMENECSVKVSGCENNDSLAIHQELKAITYHDMVIEKQGEYWIIEVICDT